MKKITELSEERWRTVHERDGNGRLVKDRVKVRVPRTVRTVKTGPRIGHFVIDLVCIQGVGVIVQVVTTLLFYQAEHDRWTATLELLTGLFILLLVPGLYVLTEYNWQRTPGKFITKTRVIDEFGNPPDLSAILLRTVIRIIPFEGFSCIGDPYSRGWHDRWSDTFVVPDSELAELKRLQAEQSQAQS